MKQSGRKLRSTPAHKPNHEKTSSESEYTSEAEGGDLCDTCERPIKETDKSVTCGICSKIHHIKCVSVKSTEYNDMKKNKTKWVCFDKHNCHSNLNKSIVKSKELNKVQNINDVDFDNMNMNEMLKTLFHSQQFISNQIDDFAKKQNQLINDNKELKQQVKKNCFKTTQLESKVIELESELNDIKQEKLANQIVISGIPKIPNEKLAEVLVKIGGKLEVNIKEDEIISARRMEKSATESINYTAPILVTLRNVQLKTELLQKQKTLGKLITDQIQLEPKGKMIYINEFVTEHTLRLFAKTKKAALEKNYKYVWIQNARVLIRKIERGKIIKISSDLDLDQI